MVVTETLALSPPPLSFSSGESSDIRGDPFITLAPRGEEGVQKLPNFANYSTDRLREM